MADRRVHRVVLSSVSAVNDISHASQHIACIAEPSPYACYQIPAQDDAVTARLEEARTTIKQPWILTMLRFVDARKSGRIHFGQVDCAANGDFCSEQKVTGYPTLRLCALDLDTNVAHGLRYRQGNFLLEYAGDRTAEDMDKFLSKHAVAPAPDPEPDEDHFDTDLDEPKPASLESLLNDDQSSADDLADEPSPAETPVIQHAQPDSPRFVQQLQARTPNEDGTVEVLDAKTFQAMTTDAQRGPTFVKFYAPWCSHCKALAPLWTKLAAELKGRINVAEVNCEASGSRSICSQQGISGFPTLILFDGADKAEFSGARSVPLMQKWALDAVESSGLQPTDIASFQVAVQSQPVVFLYAHPAATSQSDIASMHSAAKTLLGAAPVFSSSSPDLMRLLKLPGNLAHPTLAVFKGRDLTPLASFPLSASPSSDSRDTLAAWLAANKMPLAGQLTSATYPEYLGDRARTRLVVLVALSEAPQGSDVVDRSKTILSSIARSWTVEGGDAAAEVYDSSWSGVSFAWVDATLWAGWLKGTYAMTVGSMPAVVIAEPKPGLYYDTDAAGNALRLDGTQLLGALESIAKGEIQGKSSRTAAERAAHAFVGRMNGMLFHVARHALWYAVLIIGGCVLVIFVFLRVASEPMPRLTSRSEPKRD